MSFMPNTEMDNGDQTAEEVTNLILDAIQNSELKEWAKGELCA